MEIIKEREGSNLTVKLAGRLDAVTAMQLDKDLATSLTGVNELTIDLARLDYVASAGLRILLKTQRKMDRQGSMMIKNVQPAVREVLDMTGFSQFLTLEQDAKKKLSITF